MKITDLKGTVELANGYPMPYLGLGTFKMSDGDETYNAVRWALDAGYRHIDTASFYQNEESVGKAIKDSDVAREDIFVTSKLWNDEQGYDNAFKAFDRSMNRLGFEYLDLYLVHWPVGGMFTDSWKALEQFYNDGRVKAIGVSNFLKHHLQELFKEVQITPMVNQVEFHPYLVQQDLIDFCHDNGIQYEAWSPLMQGQILDEPLLKQLAEKYGKSVAQVVIRWNLQKDVVVIPKSSNKERIAANADVFDFEISDEDMQKINNLDQNKRVGIHPDTFSS